MNAEGSRDSVDDATARDSDPTRDGDRTVEVDPNEMTFGSNPDDFSFIGRPRRDGDLGQLASYCIVRLLGRGGMGLVFEAVDEQLGRRLAIKVMRPDAPNLAGRKKRFLREARAAAALRHERIVTIYQVGEDNGVPFIAMELLEGATLADRLAQGQPLEVAELLRVTRETAEGLAAAHAVGMIHRDVKPANIWLEAPSGRVKLLDFGLAYFDRSADERLTESGAIIGTPSYLAPEQVDGVAVDSRADLFALGCTMYRAATLRLPFEGSGIMAVLSALAVREPTPAEQLNPKLPAAVVGLVRDLLRKDPNARPQTAGAVVERIAAIEAKLRQGQPLGKNGEKPAADPSRRRWRAAAFLLLVVAGVALASWYARRPRLDAKHAGESIADVERPKAVQLEKPQTLPAPAHLPFPPLAPEWAARVALASTVDKVKLVEGEMIRRNPGLRGFRDIEIVSDSDVRLQVPTEDVVDLTPLSLLTALRTLDCSATKKGKLVDLRPIANLNIYYLGLGNNPELTDLRPVARMPLAGLYIHGTGVASLEPLRGKRLLQLNVSNTPVWDLSPLSSARLNAFWGNGSRIKDISPLRGMPLERAYLPLGLEILSPLSNAPLVDLEAEVDPIRDAAVLRSLTKLKTINGKPVSAYVKVSPVESARARSRFPPLDPAWLSKLSVLDSSARLREIERELARRNPGFQRFAKVIDVEGRPLRLELPAEVVSDLTPLAAEPRLRDLICTPTGHPHHAAAKAGKLVDLWPIANTQITFLAIGGNPDLKDLTPLRKLPLYYLHFERTAVANIEPLRGKRLASVSMWQTRVTTLEPLRSAPLVNLYCGMTAISDISPIVDKPLTRLHLPDAIADFGFLLKMPLHDVAGNFDLQRDGPLLRLLPNLKLINLKPAAEFFREP